MNNSHTNLTRRKKSQEYAVSLDTNTVQELPEDPQGVNASRSRRVLIADDNRDGAESLAMLLELSGHGVWVAYTGFQAVEMATLHRPDVAILDIGMPGLSGYEVAKHIRAQTWGSRITLIAVTGWGQDADKRCAQSAGFDQHLTKPVDLATFEELLAAV